MPLAIDASSPARFTGTPANGVDITSASFTPPNNTVLAASVSADTNGPADNITISVSGGGLTWSQRVERDPGSGGSSGHASIWRAVVTTGAPMTVSARRTAGNGSTGRISCKVYVVTGADTTTPDGNTGSGSSTDNNITPNAYTSSVNNSRGFGCATDWNQNGLPTSTDTEDAADYAGAISVLSLHKAADTPTSGTVVTMNFDAGGAAAADWNWVAYELLPGAGGATVNADARISARSSLAGQTAVARVSAARIAAGARLAGQSAVARVTSARIGMRSGARSAPAVTRIAQAVITVKSGLRAAGDIAGLVLADARIAFRSSVNGLALVARNAEARLSLRSLISGLPLVARVGAARLFARTGLSARFFQDTTPIAVKVSVSLVTRAGVGVGLVTRAIIGNALATRASAGAQLVTRAKTGDRLVTRAKITVSLGG